jgi:ferredoxin-NADP reductase/nitrite reductase/ring-hydroxylating ferredoxin subunit
VSTDAERLWHPVASSQDMVPRHVFWGRLLGRELAVWRADDGYVNVWENRCLHRGVRLTVGTNDGRELVCRYHGWRYASRTAGCTYIPAHPADAPARTICNRTFPAFERYGLVWSGEEPDGEPPMLDALESGEAFALRGMTVRAPSDLVIDALSQHRFAPTTRIGVSGVGTDTGDDADAPMTVVGRGDYHVVLRAESSDDGAASTAVFFAQPADADRTIIRGVLVGEPDPGSRIPVWRHHNSALSQLRDAVEAEARRRPPPAPMVVAIEEVPIHLSEVPEPAPKGRRAGLRVQVARKWQAAEDVAGFDLVSIAGQLPTFQPGAHIDVHLPNGLIRQYSLTNGPGELDRYCIGVKLEPDGGGGSRTLHDSVRVGDVLAVSEPRNNFPLRRDALRTILVAGGIGITPLLAMAQALRHQALDFGLHVFARSDDHVAFADLLDSLGDAVTRHIGLSPADTGAALEALLANPGPHEHVYVCGPGPMLDAARRIAAAAGRTDDTVHFEYFANPTEIDDSTAFTVELARSALSLEVSAGDTIMEVLRANGVEVASSCETGACGTCRVAVLDGDPVHNDVYLNDTEKQQGDQMMVCVSRARGDRLVLDI